MATDKDTKGKAENAQILAGLAIFFVVVLAFAGFMAYDALDESIRATNRWVLDHVAKLDRTDHRLDRLERKCCDAERHTFCHGNEGPCAKPEGSRIEISCLHRIHGNKSEFTLPSGDTVIVRCE